MTKRRSVGAMMLLVCGLSWPSAGWAQASAEFDQEETAEGSGDEGDQRPGAEPPPAHASAVVPPPVSAPPVPVVPPPGEQADEPPLTLASEGSEPCESASDDHAAVFRAFEQFARAARAQRLVAGASGLVAGGTLIGIGVAGKDWNDPLADFWVVMGGVTAGLSVLGFVLPSPPEVMARRHRVGVVQSPTSEQALALDRAWEAYSEKAHQQRIRGGIASLVIAGTAIGFGVAIAAGSFDFSSDSERTVVSAVLIGGGAAAAVGGVGSFFLPSAAERSFASYRAAVGNRGPHARAQSLKVGLGPSPAGFGLGARGVF